MIQYKLGVPVSPDGKPIGLHPEIEERVLPLLARLYGDHDVDCWITATSNGEHKKGSLHYAVPCRAVDVRTRNLLDEATKFTVRAYLQQMLGKDFDVLYENPGGPNQHLHIEIQHVPKKVAVGGS